MKKHLNSSYISNGVLVYQGERKKDMKGWISKVQKKWKKSTTVRGRRDFTKAGNLCFGFVVWMLLQSFKEVLHSRPP